MKSLLKYLKNYKKESIMAPLFKMLEAFFELFVPIVMALIIDKGIADGDRTYIFRMSLVLVSLAVIGLVAAVSAQFFAAKAAVGFSAELRKAVFHHIQGFTFTNLDEVGTSTLITRMTSDINQVQSGVNLVLRLFLRSPFIVIGAMIMAFTIDAKAAMIFVVTIPSLSAVVFGVMLAGIPIYKKVQVQLDKILGMTRGNLAGARVIRAFGREEEEVESFHSENELLTTILKKAGKITGLMNPVTYVMINIAIIVLIQSGAIRVDAGNITQGQVVALVNYMSQILVEIVKLATLIITVTKAFACAKRIENVFSIVPSDEAYEGEAVLTESDIAAGTSVVFENVCFSYGKAGDESLTDISFTANPGETIGITGGTGAGKSTLVNLIPAFYLPTKGRVLINGIDIRKSDKASLRSEIGVVLQKAVLFKGTVRENILWGKKDATDDEIYEALDVSQSKEFVESKPLKLDAFIDQGGKNLSGGQIQRLTIARALVGRPKILILDDSASALDYATDLKLRRAIAGMKDKPTLFIVSQRASSIREADKIIVLEDGNVAGIGKHDELMKSCPVYREICISQGAAGVSTGDFGGASLAGREVL